MELCGSINDDTYPGCEKFELYSNMQLKQGEERKVKEKLQVI